MKTFSSTLRLIFICTSAIALTMILTLEGEMFKECFPPVLYMWTGTGCWVLFYDLTNALLGMKKEARAITDQGIELGRLQERIKVQRGWTEEELQEFNERIEADKQLEAKVRKGVGVS